MTLLANPTNPLDLRTQLHQMVTADLLGPAGGPTEELDEDSVRAAARYFRDTGISAVGICLIHSYANPAHERRAADIVREEYPECTLSISCDVLPDSLGLPLPRQRIIGEFEIEEEVCRCRQEGAGVRSRLSCRRRHGHHEAIILFVAGGLGPGPARFAPAPVVAQQDLDTVQIVRGPDHLGIHSERVARPLLQRSGKQGARRQQRPPGGEGMGASLRMDPCELLFGGRDLPAEFSVGADEVRQGPVIGRRINREHVPGELRARPTRGD